ncbi:MAG: hypothetical protein ACOYIE_04260 [Agathobaculum sp.]|uniref:hypothetical protein n=1 Tax=Agathobaculum sp. TaxID=2048138 RepID=UPI003D94E9DF
MQFDPSYISRLRRGSRTLARDSEYLPSICAFLLHRTGGQDKHRLLCQAIGADARADDGVIERQMIRWLYDEQSASPVGALLHDFSSLPPSPKRQSGQPAQNDALAFYGDEGRRQATIALFNLALQQPEPVTLLLYSDEDSEWMNGSPSFSYEWTALLWQIILRGGKVKVIHKISHDIDEMFDVIRRWLPLYISGAIEPYYYPRLRDGIYKRTLSVIPDVAAAFSTSIGQQASVSTTFMTRDRQAVDSFTNEFSSYVALCRPLIEFYSLTSSAFIDTFQEYVDRGAESILLSASLSLTTVPRRVIRRLQQEIASPAGDALHQLYTGWSSRMTASSGCRHLCHILHLARPEEIAAGQVQISCAGMLQGSPVYYEPEEYCAHLEYILHLMEACPWFQVVLSDTPPEGFALHVFEDQEVYIFKEEPPYIIFRIRESNTVAAFGDYLQRMLDGLICDPGKVKDHIADCIKKVRALRKTKKTE